MHLSLIYQIPFLSLVLHALVSCPNCIFHIMFSIFPLYFTWIVIYVEAYGHALCMRVCVWGGGGGGWGRCLWVCLASVSGPVCVFVFVIRVTTRYFLSLRTKIKS